MIRIMYSVKQEYICVVQGLFRMIAHRMTKQTGDSVEIFPQTTVELSENNEEHFKPLEGDVFGDLIFGYGIKWLAYLIQEGEIIIDKSQMMLFSGLINGVVDTTVIEKCTQQTAFEICPLDRDDVTRFVSMMERKYPYMPLPVQSGDREELIDSIFRLCEKNHHIGITGGIRIEE